MLPRGHWGLSGDLCGSHNHIEPALGRSLFPDGKLEARILITAMGIPGLGWARTQPGGPRNPDLFSCLAPVSLQSVSPSPPESVVEEERPSGLGGNGKQRAEEKDLSGPYVSWGAHVDWGGQMRAGRG